MTKKGNIPNEKKRRKSMKKMVKKLSALLMAVIMVFAMSTTAFAEKTGATINVTGLSTNGDQKVTIYEIYRLDLNDNEWVKASWVPDNITPDNLLDNLEALKNAVSNETGETKNTTTGSVSFTNKQVGAYLVLAEDTTNKVTYSTMVAETWKYDEDNLIAADVANVVAKAEGYTTDKTQDDPDEVVEVGDLLKYSITTTVPYNKDNEIDSFTVSDQLTGATYYLTGEAVKGVSPVNSITLNGNASELKIDESFNGKNTFTVDLSQLINAENTNAGKTVIITYTVKIDAVDSITNTANSTNDPTGTTTKTYTGNAQITKYGDKDKTIKLSGAEFALYRQVNDTKREYAVIDGNGYITGVWTPVTATDGKFVRPEDVSTVTTDGNGLAIVKGLNTGTYYFDEVVAPDGYSINDEDKEVIVTKSGEAENITVTGETDMIDTKLSSLPSTGGIGTTIFTIGGCVIMIAAAGLFFASRRKEEK